MSMNNGYQEGYEHGLEDAKNGVGKRYTRFPKLKSLVFDNAYDTYCDGYNDGYRDGMAKKHEIYKSN